MQRRERAAWSFVLFLAILVCCLITILPGCATIQREEPYHHTNSFTHQGITYVTGTNREGFYIEPLTIEADAPPVASQSVSAKRVEGAGDD